MFECTANLTCAEPGCGLPITPRKPPEKFFLHCPDHKTNNSGIPADYPEPPSVAWDRYRCFACGAHFEWYKSSVRGSTGRLFCDIECRSKIGSKPTKHPKKKCKYVGCPLPGGLFQPHMPTRQFCSKSCARKHRRENAKTLAGRKTVNNAADLAEVRYCEGGCGKRLPPRDPINGVRRKRCEDCENLFDRPGRPALPDTRVVIVCSREGCGRKKERYKSNVNENGDLFCSRKCAKSHPGDKRMTDSGYVMIYAPGHPTAQKNGWAMEHRKVVSDLLGRALRPGEEVHHRSGDRTINTPDQLILMSTSHPAGAGLRDKIEAYKKFIAENEPIAEAMESAGVRTTMDVDANVVALFDEDGNVRALPA